MDNFDDYLREHFPENADAVQEIFLRARGTVNPKHQPLLISAFWTKARDAHLREFYNDKVKVDPALLAISVRVRGAGGARQVVKRLCALGLRKSSRYP